MTDRLRVRSNLGFAPMALGLTCFARAGADLSRVTAPLVVRSTGPLDLRISSVEITPGPPDLDCEP